MENNMEKNLSNNVLDKTKANSQFEQDLCVVCDLVYHGNIKVTLAV